MVEIHSCASDVSVFFVHLTLFVNNVITSFFAKFVPCSHKAINDFRICSFSKTITL